MMQTNHIRISELIIVRDEVNREGLALPMIGINRNKEFMPTLANVSEVDTRKYKVVRKGDFVFSGMQTGRDVCIRICLYTEERPSLISPAYTTFILDESKGVLSEFFFMYFNRLEMDRYGWFISDSSVRSNLDWPRFLDIMVPKPDIEEQRKMIAIWKDLRLMKEENEALAEPLFQLCQSKIQELKHSEELKELGDYIEESNERNPDEIFGADELMGVCSEGTFIKSIANTQGLVFTNYKVVHTGDFAYSNRINVGSIALRYDGDCIVSPSYAVFRIKKEKQSELLNDYLALWFRRSEFLRSTLFFAFGTIKDDFSHREMCRVKLPVPSLDVQEAVVELYRCSMEAKRIAAEADRLSREICPAVMQKVIHS